jgi:hypothetical protein
MPRILDSWLARAAALALSAAVATSSAAQPAPPNTISPPKGLNLGSTSFYDGFGRQSEGWTLIEYDRYESLNKITGATGSASSLFKNTKIDVAVALTQLVYTSDWKPFGGHVAFSAALPVVDFAQSSFSPISPVKLSNNGTAIGDLVWGPIFQSPTYLKDGRPRFVWRAQLIMSSPTGPVNQHRNLNQGVGYWAINPYLAFSYFPAPELELSNRINYQYNFIGSKFSSPPPIPGLSYRNGQAGQIVYDNFAASYALNSHVSPGVDGYFLDQLTPDRTNGIIVPKSRENELYIGPGVHLMATDANLLNLNTYFNIIEKNGVSGTKLNMQIIHRF